MSEAARGGQFDGGFSRSLTRFVGRHEDVDCLADLLSGHRLVTVTGPGGVGKSRLGAEVTRTQQHRFPDGIRLVELAAIRDPAQVPWAVAASLGVQDDPVRAITGSVAAVLAAERSLLVLDNCEHLLGAVAEFCHELLSDSDDIQILATSREPIGVDGEAQLRLAPLPARADTPGPGGADADGVVLFLDRVRLRQPALSVTPSIAAQAAEIVARVEGLPLAIELAAARVESMGMTHLLQRLDEPLQILTSGARTTVSRHRSLRATADWSYQLLSEQARRTFRLLAILPAPFTLETALAVAGRTTESTILSLVEASVIAPPRAYPDGRARYLMLDSLRAYGNEQLEATGESDDATSARNAHALLLAEDIAALMHTTGREASAAAWFDAEAALLHRALLSDLDRDHARALRLGLALAPWWRLRGLRSMGYPMLSRAADQLRDSQGDGRLEAEGWLGLLALGNCAWHTALQHFTTLRDAVEGEPLSTEFVTALVGGATALRNVARVEAARMDAERGRESARSLGDVEGQALALVELILAADHTSDTDAAISWHGELRTIDTACVADDVARQIAMADAVVLISTGDLPGARSACARGLGSARAARDITSQADLLYLSARIALLAGDVEDAAATIAESLRMAAGSGHRRRVLDCLDHCAHLCAVTDRWADAITMWAARSAQTAAAATADRAQDIRQRENALVEAHQRLVPAAAVDAERRGSAMTFQAATEFAAIVVASTSPSPPKPDERAGADAGLTAREKELIALVAQGHTDAQIADMLFISIRTVRSHLDRIRNKSGSRRRAELTRLALQHGLV